MMKIFVIAALGILLSNVSHAEKIDRSVDASADGHVDVSNISGSVVIEGWNRSVVNVTGTVGRKVEEVIVERNGNKVLIKVKLARGVGSGANAELSIRVPEKSSLDVGTVHADIDISGVTGEQSLHTVQGDVTTETVGADMSIESVNGDVDVSGDGSDGELYATTVSGDILISEVSGDLGIVAVSGHIEIVGGSFDRARLETVNGDIGFDAALVKNGKLYVDTVIGDVDIDFHDNISAELAIDTFNGRIDNCFGPKPTRTNKYAPGLELEFTAGGGDGRVKISTLNGDVVICK